MDMINDLALAVLHSSVQFVVAVSVGTVIDQFIMPAPKEIDAHRPDLFILSLAEMGFQVAANAVMAMAVMKFLTSLSPVFQDTSNGFGFFLGTLHSQPNLQYRVGALSKYLTGQIRGSGKAVTKGMDPLRRPQQVPLSSNRLVRLGPGGRIGSWAEA